MWRAGRGRLDWLGAGRQAKRKAKVAASCRPLRVLRFFRLQYLHQEDLEARARAAKMAVYQAINGMSTSTTYNQQGLRIGILRLVRDAKGGIQAYG